MFEDTCRDLWILIFKFPPTGQYIAQRLFVLQNQIIYHSINIITCDILHSVVQVLLTLLFLSKKSLFEQAWRQWLDFGMPSFITFELPAFNLRLRPPARPVGEKFSRCWFTVALRYKSQQMEPCGHQFLNGSRAISWHLIERAEQINYFKTQFSHWAISCIQSSFVFRCQT